MEVGHVGGKDHWQRQELTCEIASTRASSNTILKILGFKCSGNSKSSSSIEHLSKKKDFIKIERLHFFLEVLVVFSESWSFFEARTPANYPRDPVGVLPYIACHLTQFLFVQPPK